MKLTIKKDKRSFDEIYLILRQINKIDYSIYLVYILCMYDSIQHCLYEYLA